MTAVFKKLSFLYVTSGKSDPLFELVKAWGSLLLFNSQQGNTIDQILSLSQKNILSIF